MPRKPVLPKARPHLFLGAKLLFSFPGHLISLYPYCPIGEVKIGSHFTTEATEAQRARSLVLRQRYSWDWSSQHEGKGGAEFLEPPGDPLSPPPETLAHTSSGSKLSGGEGGAALSLAAVGPRGHPRVGRAAESSRDWSQGTSERFALPRERQTRTRLCLCRQVPSSPAGADTSAPAAGEVSAVCGGTASHQLR